MTIFDNLDSPFVSTLEFAKPKRLLDLVCDDESLVPEKVCGFHKPPKKHVYDVLLEFQILFKFSLKRQLSSLPSLIAIVASTTSKTRWCCWALENQWLFCKMKKNIAQHVLGCPRETKQGAWSLAIHSKNYTEWPFGGAFLWSTKEVLCVPNKSWYSLTSLDNISKVYKPRALLSEYPQICAHLIRITPSP